MKVDTSTWIKGKDYPEWMDQIGVETVSNGYILPGENVFDAFKRTAKASAERLKKPELEKYFLQAMTARWLCLASPVISNMGTDRGLPISCYGVDTGDSIEGIGSMQSELMRLSSQGGGVGIGINRVRGRGEAIRDNGTSEGVVPWVKIADSTILATNQGTVRRGAASVNLQIDHKDYPEFLQIRRPKGDINRQCLNIHHCSVIPDSFMEQVEAGDPQALKLWGETLKTRVETGEPYIMFKGNVNKFTPKAYKQSNLEVSMTNICTEITLYTDPLHSFICCLSSLNLALYDEWKNYRFENGMTLPELSCWFLEGVMQEFIDRAKGMPLMENTVRSAIKGRALGLGVLGWHTYLQKNSIPFISIASTALTHTIGQFIQDEVLKASRDQAKEYGEPEWCSGTGLRHTHHLAVAPTVSNSLIVGTSASREPYPANVYNLRTAKGVFIRKNPQLEALLDKKGKNLDTVWDQILKDEGSVMNLPDYILTPEEKEIFLTCKEINQLDIVKQTAVCQSYVDQAISLNLTFDPNDTPKWISTVHKEAWKLGLKTLYYLRTESILRGDNLQRTSESCTSCEA